MGERRIVLEPGKQPAFSGTWRVAEIRAAAEWLARWVDSLVVAGDEPGQVEPAGEEPQRVETADPW